MSRPMKNLIVFISYSSKDKKFVERLDADLKEMGVDVWRDCSTIKGGENWVKNISEAIKECDFFLLVWSKNAVSSDWVEKEISLASALKRVIIPCRKDQTPPSAILSALQFISFMPYPSALNQLAAIFHKDYPQSFRDKASKYLFSFKQSKKIRYLLSTIVMVSLCILFSKWPLPQQMHVPAGTFLSGPERHPKSLPQFWIDTTPVTNQAYKRFVDATGHRAPTHWQLNSFDKSLANHPVVNVSYYDAQAYAAWSQKRLPTCDEWEKACRGVKGYVYPWGDDWKTGVTNTRESGLGSTTPVNFYPTGKSSCGCYDMIGNVWEWIATSDSTQPDFQLIMGAAFNQTKNIGRCYDARSMPAATLMENIGFRCVSDRSQ
jgi:hypothetical protein